MKEIILKLGDLTLEMINKCIPYDQLKKHFEDYKEAVAKEFERQNNIMENQSNTITYLNKRDEERLELIKEQAEQIKILKNGGHLV